MKDNNRDMFYGGYQAIGPIPTMPMYPNNMMNMYPNQNTNMYPNMYPTNQNPNNYTDLENRLTRLENQVKNLNQRVTRLESPYNNYNNEPDNNMYMM